MAVTALFSRCARSGASPIRALSRRNFSSVKEVVPLAYHLYEPTDSTAPKKDAPVVVMHGLFGSKQNNRTISKALARDLNRPVYAVDLRNHGDSPHHKRHDYIAMAEDVEHFLVDKKLGPETTLLGHSMGAKAAMAVSLRSPSLVRDLVIVDNAPVSSILHSSFGTYIRAMRQIEESQLKKQSEADKILSEYEPNLGIRQFLLTNLTREEGSPYLKFRVPIKILGSALDEIGDFPFTPEKNRFEGRALFVRGTKSHYVPDDHIPTIGRFFPLFRLNDIDAGHWVISEKPIEFKDAVVEFLQNSE